MKLKKAIYSLSQLNKLEKSVPINLVLSGGGAKGAAHVAILEKLEALGIRINAISGSSAGALVGALYASGKRPKQILSFLKSTPLFRYTWLNPVKAGIFDSSKYELIIKDYVQYKFENLQIPLHITATNIQKGKAVSFDKGNLIPPLLASCAIPAIFSPVEIEGELFSDGGVMDNFPIKPFLKEELPILGSYVCRPKELSKKELNSIFKVTNHTNSLLLYAGNEHKFEQTHHTIVFPLGEYGAFDTKKIDEIYVAASDFLRVKHAL